MALLRKKSPESPDCPISFTGASLQQTLDALQKAKKWYENNESYFGESNGIDDQCRIFAIVTVTLHSGKEFSGILEDVSEHSVMVYPRRKSDSNLHSYAKHSPTVIDRAIIGAVMYGFESLTIDCLN